MNSTSSSLKAAAEKTLRATVIDNLVTTDPNYSIASTYDLSPKDVVCDPLSLLDDLLTPSEPAVFLQPVTDETGQIQDLVEVFRDSSEMGASSASMSLNRTPCPSSTSIKGSSNNLPFYPGGFGEALDNVMSFARVDDHEDSDEMQILEAEGEALLKCPPGFSRGMDCSVVESREEVPTIASESSTINLDNADIFDLLDFVGAGGNLPQLAPAKETPVENAPTQKDSVEVTEDGSTVEVSEEIETALSLCTPKEKDADLTKQAFVGQFAYAKILNTENDIPEYAQLLPNMAKTYPFSLDPFQQASVVCMENGESVFVAAHTSAGKTVVAEYAVALCKQHKTRAIYTSPIKALSNQKFRDFKMIFEDVGLVTGDIQLYPEAFCLVMTTEILRSMLYNGSEVIRDLEWVVFDEVHYINNAERGHVWEEVLIMLPAHVKIVMLSATVPNCVEFADWVGRIKNRRINVVSTPRRPVPLEHFIYTGQDGKTKKDLFKVVDMNGVWQPAGYSLAADAKASHRKNANKVVSNGKDRGGGRGGGRGGYSNQGGGGSMFKPQGKNDKNIYISLVDFLRSKEQLPMVVFVFSRKRCDDNAQLLSSMDLTTEVEKSHVHKFFAECISRLKGTDKVLPQVLLMRELCTRGFAVHHSGILPILKEVVELLFQKGYVKILFATETFAMGVNMPARTVVFDSIQKHDGTQMRPLNAGEYIQMAGRAGRRGLDTTGTVIVLAKGMGVPESGELQTVMMGRAARLESQFRVTYSMLLNLLRVEQLKIEDMLQRSYVESASLRDGVSKKNKLTQATDLLSSLPSLDCSVCNPEAGKSSSLREYHDVMWTYLKKRRHLWPDLINQSAVDKLLNAGRVLVVTSAMHSLQNQLVVLLKETVMENKKRFIVLASTEDGKTGQDDLKRKSDAFLKLPEEERAWLEEEWLLCGSFEHGLEGVSSGEGGGNKSFRVISDLPVSTLVAIGKKQFKVDAVEIVNEAKQRELPRFRNNPISQPVSKLLVQLDSLAQEWSSKGAEVHTAGSDNQSVTTIDIVEEVHFMNSLRAALEDDTQYPARHCARIKEHLSILRSRLRVEREVSRLEYNLSADALLLSEDYQNRLKILTALGYIEKGNMVSFKGRVACEIHHQELLITELILENKLHSRSPAEVAAMLSATTCQYKNNQELKLDPDSVFAELRDDVQQVAGRIARTAAELRVQVVDIGDEIRFDLMEVVYNWANGMPFAEIMSLTEAQEGLIVRCIQRLGEVCKDVRNASRIVGDPSLHEKMEQVSAAIKRDIVFAASLYTSL